MNESVRAPRFLSKHDLADYRRDGFLVCRGLFGPDEVAELRRATDEVQAWTELPGVWMVYADKRRSYPPDVEREPGKQYVYRV